MALRIKEASVTLMTSSTASIELRAVSKSFRRRRDSVHVLHDIDFEAYPGEFVSVIGPSGCGKSTLFSLIAGLTDADSGSITIDGRPLTPSGHAVAYMPQKDMLLPWRTIIDNAILPLEIQGVPKPEARRKVEQYFKPFGLDGFQGAHPYELSGGMRQRAALMRTVVQERPLMLLDEPFGALDSLTRLDMQDFLLQVWQEFKHTIVFITHDIREAIYLADRIYVMTARPARVRMVAEVTLPRPRRADMVALPEFAQLESDLLAALREENRAMAQLAGA